MLSLAGKDEEHQARLLLGLGISIPCFSQHLSFLWAVFSHTSSRMLD